METLQSLVKRVPRHVWYIMACIGVVGLYLCTRVRYVSLWADASPTGEGLAAATPKAPRGGQLRGEAFRRRMREARERKARERSNEPRGETSLPPQAEA